MTRRLANEIFHSLKKRKDEGANITFPEVMSMSRAGVQGCEVYAVQKGDIVIAAWIHNSEEVLSTKIIHWR